MNPVLFRLAWACYLCGLAVVVYSFIRPIGWIGWAGWVVCMAGWVIMQIGKRRR